MTLDEKALLRQRMHTRRDSLSVDRRSQAAEALASYAAAVLALTTVTKPVVSTYWTIGSELNLKPLETELVQHDSRLCLPVMVSKLKPLLFRRYNHDDTLRERAWGIREPLETAEVVTPDLLLVPLLAVDSRGARLGYGGGFYDRTLNELRRSKTIVAVGVGYDEQVVTEVPIESFDEVLDWVLTPSGLRHCAADTDLIGAAAVPSH